MRQPIRLKMTATCYGPIQTRRHTTRVVLFFTRVREDINHYTLLLYLHNKKFSVSFSSNYSKCFLELHPKKINKQASRLHPLRPIILLSPNSLLCLYVWVGGRRLQMGELRGVGNICLKMAEMQNGPINSKISSLELRIPPVTEPMTVWQYGKWISCW